MTLAHLIAFNVTLLAAMAAPGPAFLYAIKQAVTGGFWTGVATGAGLGLVAAMWTGAALLGLEAVFQAFPFIYTSLKIIGALYLVYLAWSIWKSANDPLPSAAQPGAQAFWGGVLVNLANPKSVLFAASVLIVIFPEGMSLTEKSLIVLNHFGVELAIYTLISAGLASPQARQGYMRLKPVFDRIAALVLGALALRLLMDR